MGTAPVNWNNDDLPDWAPHLPFPALLDAMAAAGYAGAEYGDGYPTDPGELRAALGARGLALCGAYRWVHLLDDGRLAAELDELEPVLALLAAAGARGLVVAAAMTPERVALAGRVPADGSAGLDGVGWARLGRNLARVAARARAHGLRTHYHNHVGTVVETPAEVERLLGLLDGTGTDLCFDTGHYAYGGGDPTAFVAAHRERIGYLHLKDVDPAVLAEARRESWGFLDALRRCIFCEFGEGTVDIARVVAELRAVEYGGWVIVEQDTSRRPPTESAAASRRYLRERCGI